MKLICYGDSWTEGEGVDTETEKCIEDRDELRLFRNKGSWASLLGKKLGVESLNRGHGGWSNNRIFHHVINDVQEGNLLSNGDFVVIMWSSTLRDSVPFLPNNQPHSWSSQHFYKEDGVFFIGDHETNSQKFNGFLKEYRKKYFMNIFVQDYLNIINQNYIICLQELFIYWGINYVFCDGFDHMIINPSPPYDRSNLIDKTKYWNFGNVTFRDFLLNKNSGDLWENGRIPADWEGTHPSFRGYDEISNELSSFILDRYR